MDREEALQALRLIREAILGEKEETREELFWKHIKAEKNLTEEEFRQFLERHEGTGGCLTLRWRLF